MTVADSFGHTDRVHFIFNQGGAGPDVALTGTSGKDVIFATGHTDTLTGGASADQFVFAPETSPSADTITDFKAGEDHIDLRAFSFVDSSNIASWLGSHAAASGADTLVHSIVATASRSRTSPSPVCMPATSSYRRITDMTLRQPR